MHPTTNPNDPRCPVGRAYVRARAPWLALWAAGRPSGVVGVGAMGADVSLMLPLPPEPPPFPIPHPPFPILHPEADGAIDFSSL